MSNVTFCDACNKTIEEALNGYPRFGCRIVRLSEKDLDLCQPCLVRVLDTLGIKSCEKEVSA